RSWQERALVSRAQGAEVFVAVWESGSSDRLFKRSGGDASRRRCGHGRRYGKVRGLAGYFQTLLRRSLARGFLRGARGKSGLVEFDDAGFVHCHARTAGPCGLADWLVFGNDGVGVSDAGAATLSDGDERVYGTAGGGCIPSRWIVAGILSQVR